jgi:UDP-N-acetylglucosamine--N-acetylmuramyl-(pentapeptide) pyrophosphoryl-undecaprenol N-acetylglucosamine transferase
MADKHIFFAGGGTGGHIYPAIAVAEKIAAKSPKSRITFFCSERLIDAKILATANFEFVSLPAEGFSMKPSKLLNFISGLKKSTDIASKYFSDSKNPVLVSVGGFVSAGPIWAARKKNVPVYMLNVDMVPGKANRMLSRYARKIFVQFEDSIGKFGKNKNKVVLTGCPLRNDFSQINKTKATRMLGLDPAKKVLLITGASSGSANINNAIAMLVEKLGNYSDSWQVVHITGRTHKQAMLDFYTDAKMSFTVLDYYDDMASLLGCADLVIGRAGAVSVAEYAVAGVPAICMPYPYHRDCHQKLNAQELVKAGCGLIVDDSKDAENNADDLWPVLKDLMDNDAKRFDMAKKTALVAKNNAGELIAGYILGDE